MNMICWNKGTPKGEYKKPNIAYAPKMPCKQCKTFVSIASNTWFAQWDQSSMGSVNFLELTMEGGLFSYSFFIREENHVHR